MAEYDEDLGRIRRCKGCNELRDGFQFYGPRSRKCDSCKERDRLQRKYSPVYIAHRAYYGMLARVETPSYRRQNVKVRVTYDNFMEWAIPAYLKFMQDNFSSTPSLDRINGGDYELGNLQVLERRTNSSKQRTNTLTYASAQAMRRDYPSFTQGQLAFRYGTNIATVNRVLNYKSYRLPR